MRRVSRVIRICALAALGAVACRGGSSDATEVGQGQQPSSAAWPCVPGESIACGGPGGCTGHQVCADDHLHYLPCDCQAPQAPPPAPPDLLPPAIANWQDGCSAIDGPGVTFGAPSDVPPLLAGKWWACNDRAPYFSSLEFTADGRFYPLTFADGGLERSSSVCDGGTYQVVEAGGSHFVMTHSSSACATDQPAEGEMQTTPPGKMSLSGFSAGGSYVRVSP